MYRRENLQLDYTVSPGPGTPDQDSPPPPAKISCTLLESGHAAIHRLTHFEHPTPTFSRLFLFAAGGCRVDFSGTEHQLVPGTLYLLAVGESFEVEYAAGSELYYFHLHLRDGQGLSLTRFLPDCSAVTSDSRTCTDIIESYGQPGLAAELRWQAALWQATAGLCLPLLPQLATQRRAASRYQKLLDYLQRECSAEMTVAALARREGLSPAALSKGFQRDIGLPLSTYLQQLLLHRACDLLCDTDQTIQSIAAELGYSDPYYFHRVFKQQTGCPPRRYRRLVREANWRG